MNTKLYRLLYCSRNRIRGTAAEVTAELQSILAKSRSNNSKDQVSGALLYNAGNFAQVLEGPLSAIERTFERIQCDPRHTEVTVIENGPIYKRDFPEWAMAFSGKSHQDQLPQAATAFEAAFAQTAGAHGELLGMLRELVSQEDEWILLDAA